MGIITKLEVQKQHKDRVNLFIDECFSCGLTLDVAVKNGLKVGLEIDEEKLKNIIFESEKMNAFNKVSNYIGASVKTSKQINDYLIKKGYDSNIIDVVINKLKEYNYINDLEFVKMYVETYKNKYGKNMLINKLKQKGINEVDLISLNDLKPDLNILLNIATKYMKNKEHTFDNFNKLFRFLMGRGYDYDDIKDVIVEFKRSDKC